MDLSTYCSCPYRNDMILCESEDRAERAASRTASDDRFMCRRAGTG